MTNEEFIYLAFNHQWDKIRQISSELVREAWVTSSTFRAHSCWGICEDISKFGDITFTGAVPVLAHALTGEQIVELFLGLRAGRSRLESEWRPSFEKHFGHMCQLPERETWASSEAYRQQIAEAVARQIDSGDFGRDITWLAKELAQELTPKLLVGLYQLAAEQNIYFDENWQPWFENNFPQVRGMLPHIEIPPPEQRQNREADVPF